MMQSMLADRFKLEFHRVTKSLPEYELVVAKSGPKLTATDPNDPHAGSSSQGPRQIKAAAQPISTLARMLESAVGAPVIDRTGLEGKYTFSLAFASLLPQEDEKLPTIFYRPSGGSRPETRIDSGTGGSDGDRPGGNAVRELRIMADITALFAGRISSPNPFWLASGPPTNCGEQVMRAFDAGWGGAVWKTLGEPIVNVTSRYSSVDWNGVRMMGLNNIELITDRPLDLNLREIAEVKKRYPRHAVIASLMVESRREAWHDIVSAPRTRGRTGSN
jgi:hypothetical protein